MFPTRSAAAGPRGGWLPAPPELRGLGPVTFCSCQPSGCLVSAAAGGRGPRAAPRPDGRPASCVQGGSACGGLLSSSRPGTSRGQRGDPRAAEGGTSRCHLPGAAWDGSSWAVGGGTGTPNSGTRLPPRGTGAPSPRGDAPPLAHAQLGWPLSSHRQRPNLLRPLSTPHSLGQGPKEHFVPLARQDRPGHPARPGASLWAAWGAVRPEPQEGRPPSSPPRPRGPHWGSNPGQVGPRSSQDLAGRPSLTEATALTPEACSEPVWCRATSSASRIGRESHEVARSLDTGSALEKAKAAEGEGYFRLPADQVYPDTFGAALAPCPQDANSAVHRVSPFLNTFVPALDPRPLGTPPSRCVAPSPPGLLTVLDAAVEIPLECSEEGTK
ncbi:uncharacterized protein [Vulpes vulpes]|uniref:Uncharacterized protein n=1 Tax=Vulpes vulpes TaxID=9627 RepID=A0ABM5AP76_VULVU